MMSAATIALIVVAAVLVLGGLCTGIVYYVLSRATASVTPAPTAAPTPRTTVKTPAATPATNDKWITADRPYVKFLPPAGWSTNISVDKEWGTFKSPKRDAVLAFTTFNRAGDATARLGKAAAVLGVTDIAWGSTRVGTVGKDRFEARTGEGSCNFEGPGGYIWYATVNTGTVDQILLIFTVASNAPQGRRAEAKAAIESLQRR